MIESFMGLWRGERPSEIIWTGDMTYWMSAEKHYGRWPAEWDTDEGIIAFHHKLGLMPYFTWDCTIRTEEVYTADVRREDKTEGSRRTTRLITPWGELTAAWEFSEASLSQAPVKHYVETEADLDILIRMIECRKLVPKPYAHLGERAKKWRPLGGYPILCLPRSPLSSFMYEWSGVQESVPLIFDRPEKVRHLLDLLEEQQLPIIEAACSLKLPLVHFADNLSSETLTGLYDEWMAQRHRRRLAAFHKAGTACVVHLDGTVRGLLPKLAANGFDGVEALTPAPVGDISAEEMADLVPKESKCVLWGGVPGAMFAPPFKWEQVEKHVEGVLKAWKGRRFILGTADQVPPNGNVDYCRRIADMLRS